MSFYLYAETAFHHEGDKAYLLKLIDEAKSAGCHGAKFQVLIDIDEFMSSKHSAYEQVKKWTFSFDDWIEILTYTKKLCLDIVLMPLDLKSLKLLDLFQIRYIEIHSVSFNDMALISAIKEVNTPLIFGIGGRTKEEIDAAVNNNKGREIVLMVGFQSFPSKLEDIKLEKIALLLEEYPSCKVGYADHSAYDDEMAILSNDYAYILGARIFEKHIAIDEGVERIDWQSAVSGNKIKKIGERLSFLSNVFNKTNDQLYEIVGKEKTYRDRQKVPVALCEITPGSVITADLIGLKMSSESDVVDSFETVLGKKLMTKKERDQAFSIGDFT